MRASASPGSAGQVRADRKTATLRSLFFKATLIVAICVAAVATALAWLNYSNSHALVMNALRHNAAGFTPILARQGGGAVQFGKAEQALEIIRGAVDDPSNPASGGVFVNVEGKDIASYETAGDIRLMGDTARAALKSGKAETAADGLIYAVPIHVGADNKVVGALATQWNPAGVLTDLKNSTTRALLVSGGIFLAALIAAAFGFRQILARPLSRINHAMSQVSEADYSTEVPDQDRGDEIGVIARSLEKFRFELAVAEGTNREALMRGTALESGTTAFMLTSTDHLVTSVNPAMVALMRKHAEAIRATNRSFDPDAMIGTRADQILPAGTQAKSGLETRAQAGNSVTIEQQLTSGFLVVTISPVLDANGEKIGHVSEWRDVTIEQRNAAVVTAIDLCQARAEFAPDGKLIAANEQFARMMNENASALIGRDFRAIMSGGSTGNVFEELDNGRAFNGRIEFRRNGTDNAILNGAFGPVLDSNGKPRLLVLLGSDVTASERALARNEAVRAEIEKAQNLVVEALRAALGNLSEGDLTATIETNFSPEYEQLRKDFNTAASNLKQAMIGVVENADAIRGEAGEISTAADDLSRRTEQQAATLEQTAAALNELTASVQSAAEVAAQANKMVEEAKKNAETSGNVVREAVLAMGEIEDSSNKISKITSVIDEIAFQTNLLALNAGVEAARAGEAGRGFAVVASEVRALAQRSSDAAREIADLISASSNQVKRGVGLVGQAGESLGGIQSSVGNIYNFVSEIAVSAREQSSGLAEINVAVNQLDQVTQQNAAMFEQTTAASHSLTREAEALNATMGHFRLETASRNDARMPQFTSKRSAPAKAAAPAPRSGTPAPRNAAPVTRSAAPAPRAAAAAPARRESNLALRATPAVEDWEDF
ncbi:methyl-accepting chemotaxis protein [Phaeovulum sp. W22_SRMD_FR3]|uniref:methyl-accepting chemotaxis protein n=1 Tax=Phaeovulum sp. W22_SRMD_FR3 TaxID=3240274 RepID=UPI003F9D2AEB